ncbi:MULTISPECIES: hypothetical protein [Streptomyces]|uniref:hypothetical protein n=1 Tax=Streptomyces TaxID=1883 RepID=UPI00048CB194|nr:hypothetical protein [Streptomyces sp. DpondAA-D4]MYY16882.1 hypothetical protein [Streptomyces sp. SID4912]
MTRGGGTGDGRDAAPVPLRAGHTHLFRGARLPLPATVSAPRPCALELEFSDGVRTPAELLAPVRPDEPWLLSVGAHRTAAGTALPARSWLVTRVTPGEDGTEPRLGEPLPPPAS